MTRDEKERLFLRLLPLIRHVAGGFSRHAIGFEREDVQQEACIAAWGAIDTHDPALGSSIENWVCNKVRLHLLSRWGRAHHPKRWAGEKPTSLSRCIDSDERFTLADMISDYRSNPYEQQRAFEEHLEGGFCHEQELLRRVYFEGKTNVELAGELHISHQRVNKKTHAAVARLRRRELRVANERGK